jgi:hypothetical protein
LVASAFHVPGPAEAYQILLTDLNGDGTLDYVRLTDTVGTAYRNLGTSRNPVWRDDPDLLFPGVDAVIRYAGLSDEDGDGDLDALVVLQSDQFQVWRFFRDGPPPHPIWRQDTAPLAGVPLGPGLAGGPPVITTVDLEGDGRPDLLAAAMMAQPGAPGGYALRVYRSTRDPCPDGFCWSPAVAWIPAVLPGGLALYAGSTFQALEAVDLDGDGDHDLVLAGEWVTSQGTFPGVAVLRNLGTDAQPMWAEARLSFRDPEHPDFFGLPGTDTRSLAFADVDADGDLDLFTYQGFFRNLGTPTQPAFSDAGEADFLGIQHGTHSHPGLEDLDGDGLPDLVIAHRSTSAGSNRVVRYPAQGTPFALALGPAERDYAGWDPPTSSSLRFADPEGDGVRDAWFGHAGGLLRSARGGPPDVPTWSGLSTQGIPPELAGLDSRHGFDWADADGDGRLEFLRATAAGGVERWADAEGEPYQRLDVDFGRLRAVFSDGVLRSPVWRDVDGDGWQDLAALLLPTDSPTGVLVVARGSADGLRLAESLFAFAHGGGESIDLADVDGDGDAELFVGTRHGGVQQFLNPQPHLQFLRDRLTLPTGGQALLEVPPTAGPVTWRSILSESGCSLPGADNLYQGGPQPGLDILEAADASGLRGRLFINVVDPAEVGRSGRVLLVAGASGASDPAWAATDHLARRSFEVLRLLGYAKENIHFLSFDPDRDLDGDGALDDIDGAATLAGLGAAFTQLALGTERLHVHLVNHGSAADDEAYMRLHPGELLAASTLRGWLDQFQDLTGAEVSLSADFCYAGAFTARLADPARTNRVLLASCGPTELTYFLARGQISYSDFLFNSLLAGTDLGTAHSLAKGAMSAYQTAWLDDDGDGVSDPDRDGLRAAGIRLGASGVAGRELPQIGAVSPSLSLSPGEPARLWAESVTGPFPIDRVWAVILPPETGLAPGGNQPVLDHPEVELLFDPQTRRYEADIPALGRSGPHRVVFFARDVWGGISFPRHAVVQAPGAEPHAVLVHTGAADSETAARAARVYRTLRTRLFPPERIHWLGDGPVDADGDGVDDVNGTGTWAAVADAITHSSADTCHSYLHVVGEAQGALELDGPLDPAALAGWLDAARGAETQRVQVVVLDHAGAGAAIPALAAPGRVVLAGAAAGRPIQIVPGLTFTDFLCAHLAVGQPLGEAVRSARRAVRRASGVLRQRVLADDDGDGLANRKGVELRFADTLRVGAAFVTGDDRPSLSAVSCPNLVPAGTPIPLRALGVTDANGLEAVWVDITAPGDPRHAVPARLQLQPQPGGTDWAAEYPGLPGPGVYSLGFQARDTASNLSALVQTQLVVTDPILLPAGVAVGPDAHEPDDQPGQAAYTDLPALRAHSLHSENDEDWVRFYALDSLVYDLETMPLSAEVDTRLEIYRELPDGSRLLLDILDEFGPGEGELGGLDFPESGFYLLRVRHADDMPAVPGTYLLSLHVPSGFGGINVAAVDAVRQSLLAGLPVHIREPGGALLASGTTVADAPLNFPGLPVGQYVVEVGAPPAFLGYFHPTDATQVPENPSSDFGNPRHLAGHEFETISYRGTALATTTYQAFSFLPYASVTGAVTDAVTRLPVAGAHLEVRRASDQALLYDRYYWAPYGIPWATGGDGRLPATARVLPGSGYQVRVTVPGYQAYEHAPISLAQGQTLNLGALSLQPQLSGNGIPDPYELAHGLALDADPDGDEDRDGLTLREEFIAGTHPGQAGSLFKPAVAAGGEGRIRLEWAGQPGRRYRVVCSPVPGAPEWLPLTAFEDCGPEARPMSWEGSPDPAHSQRFYWVEVSLP